MVPRAVINKRGPVDTRLTSFATIAFCWVTCTEGSGEHWTIFCLELRAVVPVVEALTFSLF